MSSAAAAAADPLNESTGQDAAEPQIVEGGGKGVAVIKPALVFNTDGGDVFDVPKATVKAVDNFEVSPGYKREGTRERSFMYSLGVYVVLVKEGDKQNKHKYFCLADTTCGRKNCVVPRRDGCRSNVNTHHKVKHRHCRAASVVKAGRKAAGKKAIEKSFKASKNSAAGTNRVRELLCARMAVEKFLPFSFFSSSAAWQKLVGVLTKENTSFPALSPGRIKHLLVEMYVATKKMECKDVLGWWGCLGKLKFSYLAPVAQQVFGNQAAAAQVERDFSGCGNLLKPNRSRMDTYWVEMVMFLKANYEHIPDHENISMVAAKNIRACLPERFSGKDTGTIRAWHRLRR